MYIGLFIIYDYSCPLNLKEFPFDKQNCKMTFGSWKQSKLFEYISLSIAI